MAMNTLNRTELKPNEKMDRNMPMSMNDEAMTMVLGMSLCLASNGATSTHTPRATAYRGQYRAVEAPARTARNRMDATMVSTSPENSVRLPRAPVRERYSTNTPATITASGAIEPAKPAAEKRSDSNATPAATDRTASEKMTLYRRFVCLITTIVTIKTISCQWCPAHGIRPV